MPLKAIEWMETNSLLRIVDDRIFPKEIKFIDLKDEIEIAQAIKDKAIRSQFVSVAIGYAIAMTARRHVSEDRYVFMEKLYQIAEILNQEQPVGVNINATVKRMMGLAFISDTPKDMKRLSMHEANMIESENDLNI